MGIAGKVSGLSFSVEYLDEYVIASREFTKIDYW